MRYHCLLLDANGFTSGDGFCLKVSFGAWFGLDIQEGYHFVLDTGFDGLWVDGIVSQSKARHRLHGVALEKVRVARDPNEKAKGASYGSKDEKRRQARVQWSADVAVCQ